MRHALSFLFPAMVALPAFAEGGTIAFSGDIREATCPVREARPVCTRPASVAARERAPASLAGVPLFDYARARSAHVRWRVVDIEYR